MFFQSSKSAFACVLPRATSHHHQRHFPDLDPNNALQHATGKKRRVTRKPEARSTRERFRLPPAYGRDRTRAYEARVLYLIAYLLKQASLRNGITPPRTGPLFCTHFAALLKFSKYNIIWPVMALACGSLHTAVTFVPNG